MNAATVHAAAASKPIDGVALAVVIVIFALVAVLGFLAARWRTNPEDRGMRSLDQWGLGGRGFGNWITWFLLGGDLYTAYTFIAVPAAIWSTGAVSGFFAVPYTVVLYPIVFVLMRASGRFRIGTDSLRPPISWAAATEADLFRQPLRSRGSLRRCRISRFSWWA